MHILKGSGAKDPKRSVGTVTHIAAHLSPLVPQFPLSGSGKAKPALLVLLSEHQSAQSTLNGRDRVPHSWRGDLITPCVE